MHEKMNQPAICKINIRARICRKEAPRQVTFGELQGQVPGMPDERRAGLEEPLLEAREGSALDGGRQDQPALKASGVLRHAIAR